MPDTDNESNDTPTVRQMNVKISSELVERFDEMYPMVGARTYFVSRVMELAVAKGDHLSAIADEIAEQIVEEL